MQTGSFVVIGGEIRYYILRYCPPARLPAAGRDPLASLELWRSGSEAEKISILIFQH